MEDIRLAEFSDAEVYAQCAKDLVRFATGLVGPSDAADVVSAAVVRCLSSRAWPTVHDRRAYLFRAVLNEARAGRLSRSRREARERRVSPPEAVLSTEIDPGVGVAVARLSVRQRAVVVLTYWADQDPASIAELLGVSEGTVRRHLARARSRLRRMLDA
jgi:RNA polymerase sigma factor (sigma-70 family)